MKAFQFLPRVLHSMLIKRNVAQAEIDAEAAARQGDVNHGANQTIRLSKVDAFLRGDPAAAGLSMGLLLNGPLQHYLNKTFLADKCSRACVADALMKPAAPDAGAVRNPSVEEKLQDASKHNLDIISRKTAARVLAELSGFLVDYDHEQWATAEGLSRAAKFEAAKLAALAATHAWRRLDELFNLPKYRLLTAVAEAGLHNLDDLEAKLAPLRQAAARCDSCIDKAFTGYWLRRLEGGNRRAAVAKLKEIVPFLPLSTGLCERKHTLGQEVRAQRRRGRGVKASTISTRTYRKSAQLQTLRVQKRVLTDVLPAGDTHAKAAFTRQLMSCSLRRRADRRRKRPQGPVRKPGFRQLCGFNAFRRCSWTPGVRPATEAGAAEERRISERWRSLMPEQQDVYRQQADEDNDRQELGLAPLLPDDRQATRSDRRRRKRIAFAQLDEVIQHEAWSAGAATACFGCALRPDHVNKDLTDAVVQRRATEYFQYDDEINVNPEVMPQSETPCHRAYGGLCQQYDDVDKVCTVLANLYSTMKTEGVKQDKLPLVLALCIPECALEERLLLTLQFGQGEFFAGLGLQALPDGADGGARFCLALSEVSVLPTAMPFALHGVVYKMLRAATAALGSLDDVGFISARLYNIEDVQEENRFAVRIHDRTLLFDTPLQLRRRKAVRRVRNLLEELPFGLGAHLKADD